MKEKIEWNGHTWLTRQSWGSIHPKETHQYHSEDEVSINNEGHLVLSTSYNPKTFTVMGESVLSIYSIGLVYCMTDMGYGTYEIEAKLPKGSNIWGAFWLWGKADNYVEIDVFENYTGDKGSYLTFNPKNPFRFWNVKANVHYIKDNGDWVNTGSNSVFTGFKNPSKHFVKYKLVWTEDKIEIWYGSKLVRLTTDSNTLKWFKDAKMNVVIGTGLSCKASDVIGDYVIKSFVYKEIG